MTNLKIEVDFNNECVLSTKDITGFKTSGNPNGFVPENGTRVGQNDYKISDGYFIDVIILHKYNCVWQITNPASERIHIPTSMVSSTYSNNFSTKFTALGSDGVFTYKRLFIISKEFYDVNFLDITRKPIYYDGTEAKFYKVEGGVHTEITLFEVVDTTVPTITTGAIATFKFASTCYLTKCLFLLQRKVNENGLALCNTSADTYKKQRDYIFTTLNVIEFLKEGNNYIEIQRLIEASQSCGVVCKEIGNKTGNDCGCN